MARGSRKPHNIKKTKVGCVFFRIGFRSSERRRHFGSLLIYLGVKKDKVIPLESWCSPEGG